MHLPDCGWRTFPPDSALRAWATEATGHANRALSQASDWRCGGTWWPGVDALPNDPRGAIGAVPLAGDAIAATGRRGRWHRAQVSVCLPGYPDRGPDETEAQHRYRRTRDSAHLDGLLPVGPHRHRMLREPHAFVLGIGLSGQAGDAAPLVVWDGSHTILGAALSDVLSDHPAENMAQVDLTNTYQRIRARTFDICIRREIELQPGGAILLHRHLLHGIAPWRGDQTDLRITAYFRPLVADIADWLSDASS